ncbi:AIPR family protein [Viridibacillus arvi]|uniref:AIPR family protein n=1 Tax=Viridibacillus arvi TaxID=263475 RepID=UPI003D002AC0
MATTVIEKGKNNFTQGECQIFEFKVDSARVFTENKGQGNEQMTGIFRVDVQEVPEGIWRETNLRERNFKTPVAKEIFRSLVESTVDNFHLLNRGILWSAYKFEVFERNNEKYVRLYLNHRGLHGNVDGAHTEDLIIKYKSSIKCRKRVTIEIMTGIEGYFEILAASRNTNVQVQNKSKAELAKKFEYIKKAIKDKRYAKEIIYKENQEGTIDIDDLLAIFTMFNIERFPENSKKHPTVSYGRKSSCEKYFLEAYDNEEKEGNPVKSPYRKMIPIITDIIKLVDTVERDFPNLYINTGHRYSVIQGVAQAVKGKGYQRLYADGEEFSNYSSPNGFIYPIVAAFRYLVKEENGEYSWKKSPFLVFSEIGEDMVLSVIETHKSLGSNANATGKFIGLWDALYNKVKINYLENH